TPIGAVVGVWPAPDMSPALVNRWLTSGPSAIRKNGRASVIDFNYIPRTNVFAWGEVHEPAVPGTARHAVALGVLATTGLLDEQFLSRPHQSLVILDLNAFLQCNEALVALLYDGLWDLVRHGSCRGAGAWRVLKGKCAGKARLLDDVEGCLEVLFRFARESHDDVGGDSRVRNALADLVEDPQEFLRTVGATHLLEDAVGARLQRHVQLRAD